MGLDLRALTRPAGGTERRGALVPLAALTSGDAQRTPRHACGRCNDCDPSGFTRNRNSLASGSAPLPVSFRSFAAALSPQHVPPVASASVASALHKEQEMRLSTFLLLVATATAHGADARAAPALDDPLPLSSTGHVTIARPVSDVFAALADPLAWPRLLTDVERVERDRRDAKSWRVVSKLLGHAHVLELTLERDRLVHFHVTDPGPGGKLVVDIRFEPLAADRTRVWYAMKTVLPLGLDSVFDDDFIRRVREKKIVGDLADIERQFGEVPAEPRSEGAGDARPTP
ncbi:MAG: SRPBCC family protein [Deltaproteobacteria bacterium]|nr:SRPBCC family protein [Deltaproteobacteria bacterium]